jgi:hypothetical protein
VVGFALGYEEGRIMTQFWRQNGLIIAGIALPLLVALGVLVVKEVERSRIPPPQHAVLFAVYAPDYYLDAEEGRLYLVYKKPPRPGSSIRMVALGKRVRLFLFDPDVRTYPTIF